MNNTAPADDWEPDLGPDSGNLAAALADMGMHIFPVDHPSLPTCVGLHKKCDGQRGKHPTVRWKRSATTSSKVVAAKFTDRTLNVGISCGPSNLVVLDEDELGVLERWAADNGVTLPDTYTVTTGRGRHLYYRWDHSTTPITNSDKLFGDLAVNVRGHGGFVVAAGSMHENGTTYTDNGRPIAVLPADLAERLIAAQNTKQHNTTETFTAQAQGNPNTTPILYHHRHPELLKYAGRLRNAGLDHTEAEALFRKRWELCEQPPGKEAPFEQAKQAILDDVYRRYPAGKAPEGDDSDPKSFIERGIEVELDKLRIRREAKRRLDAEDRPVIEYPPVKSLATLLGEPDTPIKYRIESLAPESGRVMLSAQYKAGKTTLVGNLLRSLVDGDKFLGAFAVNTFTEHAVLIDTEMSENTLRRWLRDQDIVKTSAVADVIALRGKVSGFNLLDEHCRAQWVTRLLDLGCDYLILDCLRPVLDSLGLDENRDAGLFLVAFDALMAEAGIGDSMTVQHMGHSNERARGDSRLQDWPDAIWRLVRETEEPDSDRFFSAYGRDVDVREGRLSFDPRSRRLTYAEGSRTDAKVEAAKLAVIELLAAERGALSKNSIEQAIDVEHSQKAIRGGIAAAVKDGLATVSDGPNRAKLHRIAYPCSECGKPVASHRERHESCQ